jgi:hypothetical protein
VGGGRGRERERERKKNSAKKGEKTFFPCLCGSRGGARYIVPLKTTPLCASFLCEQRMKRHSFVQNTSFYLKENDAKTCQIPNQSLIFYLLNQVLNCNFDFKNQFNYIPVKFNLQP